jgi:malonyl CoA-acyl carrier protein transacylase
MKSAADMMQEKFEQCMFNGAKVPVITNVDARAHQEPATFKQNLVDQICGRVRWRETMHLLQDNDITHVIEVGPGKVLSNISKRMLNDKITLNVGATSDFEKLFELFH